MIDFVDSFYYKDYSALDGYDREKAKQKAFSVIVPLIMKNELTPKQSACLQYKYINHKTQAQIAELLKISQPTVSRHINTAKDIMNHSLQYCYIALSKAIDEYEKLSNS
ncbi:MAG: sigma factor-like helix-turn-helix DNA-binding protein [Eubacterium sp.]